MGFFARQIPAAVLRKGCREGAPYSTLILILFAHALFHYVS